MGLPEPAVRLGLELLAASQLAPLVRRLSSARGVIFALHRVLPEPPADFAPNAGLQVTPDFLAFAVGRVRTLGYEIVGMDEAVRRIEAEPRAGRFAALSFDGAYRDNLRYALPILRQQRCPFTLYAPTALVDGIGEVWWLALEELIGGQSALAITHRGETEYLPAATDREKSAAYASLAARMHAMPEPERRDLLHELCRQYNFDLEAHCRRTIMGWGELKTFASEPLCTIGAATVHHYALSKLPPAEARNEIGQSIRIIDAQFGIKPAHFAYPFGDAASSSDREFGLARELGLTSAVTSRWGGIYPRHRHGLHTLPRIPLGGIFQARRYLDLLATPGMFPLPRN